MNIILKLLNSCFTRLYLSKFLTKCPHEQQSVNESSIYFSVIYKQASTRHICLSMASRGWNVKQNALIYFDLDFLIASSDIRKPKFQNWSVCLSFRHTKMYIKIWLYLFRSNLTQQCKEIGDPFFCCVFPPFYSIS